MKNNIARKLRRIYLISISMRRTTKKWSIINWASPKSLTLTSTRSRAKNPNNLNSRNQKVTRTWDLTVFYKTSQTSLTGQLSNCPMSNSLSTETTLCLLKVLSTLITNPLTHTTATVYLRTSSTNPKWPWTSTWICTPTWWILIWAQPRCTLMWREWVMWHLPRVRTNSFSIMTFSQRISAPLHKHRILRWRLRSIRIVIRMRIKIVNHRGLMIGCDQYWDLFFCYKIDFF